MNLAGFRSENQPASPIGKNSLSTDSWHGKGDIPDSNKEFQLDANSMQKVHKSTQKVGKKYTKSKQKVCKK